MHVVAHFHVSQIHRDPRVTRCEVWVRFREEQRLRALEERYGAQALAGWRADFDARHAA